MFSLEHATLLKVPQLISTGEYPNDIVQYYFQNCACCENYLKDKKHHSFQLVRKCMHAKISFFGHYLFSKAHSFPKAIVLKNC